MTDRHTLLPLTPAPTSQVLAPMEGLTDPLMRKILTEVGRFDWCVSEFIRVTDKLLPVHVIQTFCPEMQQAWRTASGTPLQVQFLGSDPAAMADNAAQAAALGAVGVDLNFGCPAKTVNRHGGGAALLTDPENLYQIASAVRRQVPESVPVSAKMRLGYDDPTVALANAQALEAAGVNWLTVHARTKVDGYRPPAYWSQLAPLVQALDIPIIANGEIWNENDAERCQDESHCPRLMLGRGAVTRPDLSRRLRGEVRMSWSDLVVLQQRFLQASPLQENSTPAKLLGRYKQWLGMLTGGFAEAATLWEQVRREKSIPVVLEALAHSTAATAHI